MEITIEQILSIFKNNKDGKKMKEIKAQVVELLLSEENGELTLYNLDENKAQQISQIEKEIEQVVKEELKKDKESRLKYANGKYTKRPIKTVPPTPIHRPDPIYIGTAGETAVMSELMFNGYNVNRMMIDDGVDIVAAKDNIYFYVQVKTTFIENGRIYCQISDMSYDRYIQTQIRYVIVARYNDRGIDRNMFFVFNNQDIEKGIHDRYIKRGLNCISIKVKFHPITNEPFLYDEKESNISYHLNNFKLI
ncbi:MAG: hypothetical protein IJE18_06365 [Bacteroidaceae bacterium]|nr:hypothetical protein [Bacteroidaceae bacterium]MBQ3196558.1 hypothetical protein [Alistipes sp.]